MANSKKTGRNSTILKSALIAAGGFSEVLWHEWKVRLAFVIAFVCIALAIWVKATYIEVILIVSAWTQVIVGEIFNTALEKAMDYVSDKEFHPLIKRGKDYAAASVFVLSVLASCLSVFIITIRFF